MPVKTNMKCSKVKDYKGFSDRTTDYSAETSLITLSFSQVVENLNLGHINLLPFRFSKLHGFVS